MPRSHANAQIPTARSHDCGHSFRTSSKCSLCDIYIDIYINIPFSIETSLKDLKLEIRILDPYKSHTRTYVKENSGILLQVDYGYFSEFIELVYYLAFVHVCTLFLQPCILKTDFNFTAFTVTLFCRMLARRLLSFYTFSRTLS